MSAKGGRDSIFRSAVISPLCKSTEFLQKWAPVPLGNLAVVIQVLEEVDSAARSSSRSNNTSKVSGGSLGVAIGRI